MNPRFLRNFLIFTLLVTSGSLIAQPTWNYTNTGANHTILVQAGTVTIDGTPLSIGDYIGVFFLDAGNLVCGGYAEWTAATPNAVTAWGDDTQSPIKDGFNSGEAFNWKVWRASDGAIVDMVGIYNPAFPSGGSYTTNGMSAILTMTGNAPAPSFGATGVVTQPLCYGTCDGAIDLSVVAGTPPFSYSWSNGATTEDLTGLCAGTYDVTVSEGGGGSLTMPWSYTNTGANHTILVQANTVFINSLGIEIGDYVGVFFLDGTDYVCGGYAEWTASTPNAVSAWGDDTQSPIKDGFNSGETFNWKVWKASDGAVVDMAATFNPAFPSGSTYTTNGMSAILSMTGTYTPTVGASTTASFTLTDPTEIFVFATLSDYLGFNISVYGGSDGSIDQFLSGATPPYSFLWSNGATTEDISALIAGDYYCTVTDANGCEAIEFYTLTQPAGDPLAATGVSTNNVCYGECLAEIDLSVTGGMAPYTYAWSNSGITQDLVGLCAGSYDVTVTDAIGGTITSSFTITEPTMLQISEMNTSVSCFGGSDGSIDVTVTGGTPPYTYSWVTGQSTEDLTGLAAGNYEIYVYDANNCSNSLFITVSEPAQLFATLLTNNAVCNGGTGSTNVILYGGTAPFTYAWSNGATTLNITNVTADSYYVTVTDANGCELIDVAFITEPLALANSAVITDVQCYGASTGAIDLTVSGGTAPYTYLWDNSMTNEDISGLVAGNYLVTIYDANNCMQTATFTVAETAQLMSSTSSVMPSCFGGLGSIDLTVSGGMAPYSYLWTNGATTEDLIDVTENFYEVTVTDTYGCTATGWGDLYAPTALSITEVITNVSCYGGTDGSIDITVMGGTMPYSYNWGVFGINADLMNLAAGTFDLTVTDDNGCVLTTSYTVTQADMITVTPLIGDVSCNGGNDGYIDLSVVGGVFPYSFAWSNSNMTSNNSGLNAGTYTVTVTDGNACEYVDSYVVAEPTSLSLTSVLSDYSGYNISINGAADGSIDITPAGGTAPYTYSWTGGSTMEDLSGLVAGTYDVVVTDANGCFITESFTLTEPAAGPVLAATFIVTDVTCLGGIDGAIDMSVSGGIPPYSFIWSNGPLTEDISGLAAGTYMVTINDSFTNSEVYTVVVNDGVEPVVELGADMAICDGDSYILDAGVFTSYAWTGGETTQTISAMAAGTYGVTVTDTNGCIGSDEFVLSINALPVVELGADMAVCDGDSYTLDAGVFVSYAWTTAETTQTISVMTAGNYAVTVTDTNGCMGSDEFMLTVNALPVVELGADMAVCDGDSYTLDAGVFSAYAWSTLETTQTISVMTAGNYSVTVTDTNGCYGSDEFMLTVNALPVVELGADMAVCDGDSYTLDAGVFSAYAWSTLETTQTISVMTAGNYSVEVTDANGCMGSDEFVLSINALPVVELGLDMAVCDGESYILDAGVFSAYAWSTLETTQTISVMTAGNYSVTVTDMNGCIGSDEFVLTVNPLPVVNLGADMAVCDGDSYTLDAGVFPVYSWSTLETTQTISVMTAGSYIVTVTDANGCKGNDEFILSVNALPVVNLGVDMAICDGDSYTLDAGVFSAYAWNTLETTQTISVMTAGNYSVEVTDVNGCMGSDEFVLSINALPVVELGADMAVCDGDSYTLDAGVFSAYAWTTAETTQTISVMTAGNYSVTVTDMNGCMGSDEFVLTVNPLPVVNLGADMAVCDGDSYTLDAGVFSAYAWSTLETTQTISVMTAGNYSVTVTDTNGCFGSDEFMLTVNALPVVELGADMAVCDGDSYTLDAGVFASYAWSTLETTQTISVMTAGNYSVEITDANGCMGSDEFILSINALPVVELGADMAICDGDSYTLDAGVFSAYAWSTLETTQTISVMTAGNYSVEVTDMNGCMGSDEFILTINALPVVELGADMAICDGDSYTLDAGVFSAYVWNTLETTQTISVMTAGNYSIEVTDVNGCMGSDEFVLSINALPVVELGADMAICDGDSYTLDAGLFSAYTWSTLETTQTVSVMTAGNYSVEVTDANGCMGSDEFILTVNALPLVDLGADAGVCIGSSMVLDAGVFSSYAWSNSETTQTIEVMTAGTYSVIVTDVNGCMGEDDFVLTVNNLPAVDLGADYQYNQFAGTTIDAGVFASYLWSNGETTQSIYVTTEGFFSVTVTDMNGCEGSDEILVSYIPTTNPPDITSMTPIANSSFDGNTTLTITVIDTDDLVTQLQMDITKVGQTGMWTQFILPTDASGIASFNTMYTGIATLTFAADVFTFTFNTLSPANPFIGFPGWGDGEYLFTYIAYDELGNQSGYYNNLISPVDEITYFIQAQYDEHVLTIPQGYSMISTYVDPINPNVAAVFAPLGNEVIIIKDENGNPYWPAYGLNNVGNMVIGEGYIINMASAQTLTVQGEFVVPELNPILLQANWSMFGYLRTSSMSIETALASVVSDILVVKNSLGLVYWPQYTYNAIGDLYPGEGYKANMFNTNAFTYPANTVSVAKSNISNPINTFYKNVNTTSSNMTIGITVDAWEITPEIGDEIAILNADGELAGAAVYNGSTVVVTVWGDNNDDKSYNGMAEGMDLTIKLWSKSNQSEETLVVSEWVNGNGTYSQDAVITASKIKIADVLLSSELFQNSPNPVRDITNISFFLGSDSDVTLSVFNLLGERIEVISLSDLTTGMHSVEFNASDYPVGAYLYKIETADFTYTRQMTVVK